jgi:hypothetical protein
MRSRLPAQTSPDDTVRVVRFSAIATISLTSCHLYNYRKQTTFFVLGVAHDAMAALVTLVTRPNWQEKDVRDRATM